MSYRIPGRQSAGPAIAKFCSIQELNCEGYSNNDPTIIIGDLIAAISEWCKEESVDFNQAFAHAEFVSKMLRKNA